VGVSVAAPKYVASFATPEIHRQATANVGALPGSSIEF
jgi:hypothetical protein